MGAGLIIALTSPLLLACSDIQDGINDIDSWPEVKDYVGRLQHPCMLHTESDFEFIKDKVEAGAQPWANAFAHLESNKHAQSNWTATPVKKLARLDATNWATINGWETTGIAAEWYNGIHTNYTNLMYDAASAYALALRWKISGDNRYADAAVKILNAWATTCTGYIVNAAGEFIDPNEYLIAIQIYQMANAGEILRSYSNWSSADFTKYKAWMVDVFYPQARKFLNHSEACPQHTWLNWDLSEMTAVLSIGILTDDNYKINEAIQYFKYGIGNGNIYNAVPFVYKDPDSNEIIGQGQESGRDQGHATLCVSLLGVFCQMAKNIGEDLLTFDENRALAMCEYIAKYNYGTVESNYTLSNFKYDVSRLPYTLYQNCDWTNPSMSSDGRGSVRPAWELIHRMALDYKLSDIYTKEWVLKMRENASRGYGDGGSGDYGPNSGGYDQLGWGTLMYAKE
ncbi:membrane protein [Bacteroidia bacterium]|nr:membrane protein [Bacteroidia bacterium]